jgi:hypothetical protein
MTKIRRGGYIFVSWKGDHSPHHVHVYRDGRFVAKWNIEDGVPMSGAVNARLRTLIRELVNEGRL